MLMANLVQLFHSGFTSDLVSCLTCDLVYNNIINTLFFYCDHVTYKVDFQRAINEVKYIYTHG